CVCNVQSARATGINSGRTINFAKTAASSSRSDLPFTGFGHGTRPRFHVGHERSFAGAGGVIGTIVPPDSGGCAIPEGCGLMVQGGFFELLCSFIVGAAFSYTSAFHEALE